MTPTMYTNAALGRNNIQPIGEPDRSISPPIVTAARRVAQRYAIPLIVARAHCEAAGLGREVG